jgi:hypothetical protein
MWLCVGSLVGGAVLVAVGLRLPERFPRDLLFIFGVPSALFGGLLPGLLPRWSFRRREGICRWRAGWLRRRQQMPLSDILAVQALHGGWIRPEKAKPFETFELNLVLTDLQRIGVTRTKERAWVAMASVGLAEFLGVPLVSHLDADRQW